MSVFGTVVSAPGSQGFDTDTQLSSTSARGLRDAGFGFCLSYLTRDRGQQPHDLTTDEADGVLDAGFALMTVQHVAAKGGIPPRRLGRPLARTPLRCGLARWISSTAMLAISEQAELASPATVSFNLPTAVVNCCLD